MHIQISVSNNWKKYFPNASLGVLMMKNVANGLNDIHLQKLRSEIEQEIKTAYSGKTKSDIKNNPIIRAYREHYKKFGKSYHVRLQLESIAFNNKSFPNKNNIIEAMFLAELKNLLLTAVHDLDHIKLPVTFDISSGQERYELINQQEQQLKTEDMMMTDADGVICSVIHGPDYRTRARPETRNVLFTVYAPGIESYLVNEHLNNLQKYVLSFSPQAKTDLLKVYP